MEGQRLRKGKSTMYSRGKKKAVFEEGEMNGDRLGLMSTGDPENPFSPNYLSHVA